MEPPWFKSIGWVYRPVTVAGWLATLLPVAFAVNVFVTIDRHSHSASDTLYGIFPFWASTFLLWLWVADKTSRQDTDTKN